MIKAYEGIVQPAPLLTSRAQVADQMKLLEPAYVAERGFGGEEPPSGAQPHRGVADEIGIEKACNVPAKGLSDSRERSYKTSWIWMEMN